MKINCVIVNFNDAPATEKLVRRISPYSSLEQIVIVDNASTDDSLTRLNLLAGQNKKISVVQAPCNGGYGAGNNLGVRYAAEHNHATHVIIANPDVSFDESCILGLARIFQNHPDAGVASALMEDKHYKPLRSCWKNYGFIRQLLYMGPVSHRLFGFVLYYPRSYFKGRKAVWVDAVHGSMLMVDSASFLECGGYDEGIFLYQEEMVLADRMKTLGRRTALLLTKSYKHEHSVSVSKTFQKELERQRLRETSVLYYMKHYLYINPFQESVAKLWFWGIRMEVRLFRALFSRPSSCEADSNGSRPPKTE